jgi:4-hydroxysphinganine ceramide fatty acyl 2-hydroxylase
MVKVKKEGTAQLFTNARVEIFTRTNPVLHVITYGGAILFFFIKNSVAIPSAILFFFAGVFAWTLMEYFLHRYLFHIKYEKFQYLIHGVHHEFPRDKERLLMPPVPGIVILSVIFGFYYLFLGEYTFAFMAGVVTGYMLYTFIHYIIHTWKPVKGFKFLWSHHHKHHNPAFENTSYGVSTPLWDYVFGTMPPNQNK